MEVPKKFLHDRVVLLLVTLIAIIAVVGVSIVLIRFDVSKNPTTITAYRPNVAGADYQSGKPIDIYSLALFMIFTAVAAVMLGAKTYNVRRSISLFILSSSTFVLILSTIVANALISIQ